MSGIRRSPLRPYGALAVLAGAFALSAVLRTGEVIAALPAAPEDGFGNALPATQNPEPGSGAAPGAAPSAPTTTDPGTLVAQLENQRAHLETRAAALDERAQTLEAIEARLRAQLDEIARARAELESTAALVDDAAGKDVRHLAAMYQRMKPKEASAIFDKMAPSFAAGFLAEMEADAAASIMANMDADKAYAVSLLLAGRNLDLAGPQQPPGLQPSLNAEP